MGIQFDFLDPLNTRVVLESSHRLASQLLLNPRFTVTRPEDGQSTELTGFEARPAVREVGAYRSDAPADSTGGVVTPAEYS